MELSEADEENPWEYTRLLEVIMDNMMQSVGWRSYGV